MRSSDQKSSTRHRTRRLTHLSASRWRGPLTVRPSSLDTPTTSSESGRFQSLLDKMLEIEVSFIFVLVVTAFLRIKINGIV